MDILTFIAEKADANKRADVFLAEEAEDLSRSRIQRLIETGDITVNDKKISKNYKLKEWDRITVTIKESKPADILAENIELDILYEDDDVIVINKPQGMVVHPAAGHFSGTLVNGLMYHCGGSLSGINGVMRPGIVHRIDMNTSGILVAAKNDAAHNFLAKQLAEHSMNRIYYGIVYNSFKETEGTVNKPIGRNPSDRKKMAVVIGGRQAITHFYVMENLGKYAFVRFKLETGRTHQIRVHMASIGHPLLGDDVYGPKKCPYTLKGQALHAGLLGFIHPKSREYLEFKSPLPAYFEELLKRLGK